MSKKSRRRNKKILAALALAGGAAMLGRGKGTGAVTGVPLNPNLQKTIAADAGADIAAADTAVTGVVPIGKMAGVGTDEQKILNQKKRADYAQKMRFSGNLVPPSMRGGAAQAEGFQRYVAPNRQWPGGYVGRKGGGIAKRGKGAAYKSGGRVKSMGIAKRGGGIAKR